MNATRFPILIVLVAIPSLGCQFDTNGVHDAAAQAKYDAWIQSQSSDVQRRVVGKVLTAADNTEFWKTPQVQQPQPSPADYRREVAPPSVPSRADADVVQSPQESSLKVEPPSEQLAPPPQQPTPKVVQADETRFEGGETPQEFLRKVVQNLDRPRSGVVAQPPEGMPPKVVQGSPQSSEESLPPVQPVEKVAQSSSETSTKLIPSFKTTETLPSSKRESSAWGSPKTSKNTSGKLVSVRTNATSKDRKDFKFE